jgi:putative flippase GtrA
VRGSGGSLVRSALVGVAATAADFAALLVLVELAGVSPRVVRLP